MASKKTLKCFYCGEDTFKDRRIKDGTPHMKMRTKDHLVPKAKGGGNNYNQGNTVVCCYECNQEKKDMTYREFLIYRGALSA